jgi:hypothetical protein
MSGNKVIKSVAFNKTNPEDVAMLKAISRRNFSGYVKKLIAQDLKEKGKIKEEPKQDKEKSAAEKLEEMKKGLK